MCDVLRTHGNQTLGTKHASGVELRSGVDGRYLPDKLRVRVHCRWRVTPSRSFCLSSLGTRNVPFSGLPRKESSMSARHHLERPNIVLSRNSDLVVFAQISTRAKNNLRVSGPNVSRGLYFRAYVDFARLLWNLDLYFSFFCIFVLVRPVVAFVVVFLFSCARLSVFVSAICGHARLCI